MKAIKIIFIIIGLCLISVALYLRSNTNQFLDQAISTNGEVVDLIERESRSDDGYSITYAPVVAYEIPSGEVLEFMSNSSSNPPSYSIGEEVEVLFLPSDPNTAKIGSFFSLWGASIIVGSFGVVFFLIGGGIVLFVLRRNRLEIYLKEHGMAVIAEYKGVELNGSLEVNGRNPFRIIANWLNPSTNELFIFKSKNLWFDPSDYINKNEITVYVDKNNPKKHFVDTSFLPKVAN